jgi:protein-disulfide isomerase
MSAERNRRLLLLGGVLLAAIVVVVVAIVVSQGSSDDEEEPPAGGGRPQASQSEEVERQFGGIPQEGVALGEPDAPATLIEFADLQCPFCAEYAVNALPSVVDRFVRPGRLRLELRLLRFLGPDSERGAEVAAAATLQNRLWEFSELFFRNQGPENSGYATDQFLERLARATPGLDVDQLERDLDSPPAQRFIRQADRLSNGLGVEGTPAFYLSRGGGRPEPLEVTSLEPDAFVAELEDALGAE